MSNDKWIEGGAWQSLIVGRYQVPVPAGSKLDPLVINNRSWENFNVATIYCTSGNSPQWIPDGAGGEFLAVWLGPAWINNKRAWRPFWEIYSSLDSAERYCQSLLNDLKLGDHGLAGLGGAPVDGK
ncbi:MAG: hypothetical protein WB421_14065 [Terriglobales bacterium]